MYKILPAEPTPEMWKAALAVRLMKRCDEGVPHPPIDRVEVELVWKALTDSAPTWRGRSAGTRAAS